MSRIDDLIKEHCPDGVEYKPIEEVCVIANNKRKPVKSSLRVAGETPYYGANSIQDYVDGYTHEGNYVLIAEDGSANLDDYSIQYTDGKFWANNHIHVIQAKDKMNNRFLFYYLKNMNFRPFLSGGERAKLTKSKMIEIPIPFPPLPVQQEIVTILDKFTKLEAKLEAELEARQRQYAYYRNSLLMSRIDDLIKKHGSEGVEYTTLGGICTLSRGRVMSKDYLRNNAGHYPVYSSQTANNGVFGKINIYDQDGTFITWTTDGANAGSVFYRDNEKFSITNVCGLISNNSPERISLKFLYYLLSITAKSYVYSGMGNPKLMSNVMSTIKIPIPPIPVQQEIVTILDKFDALVNDISSGLPAEITARRKQYEYYRNRLLTFREAA